MSSRKHRAEPRNGSLGKKIVFAFAGFFLLLIIAYFAVTSSAFFKTAILPRVGKAINADVQVQSASISPFSRVLLRKIRVQTTGPEPLLTAEEVRVRYGLLSILRGNIQVDEMTLVAPTVHVVREIDGASNLDPLLKRDGQPEEPKRTDKGSTQLSIRNVSVQNATFKQSQKLSGGGLKMIEARNVNVALDKLGNGQSGTLKLSADFHLEHPHPGGTNDLFQGRVEGGLAVTLGRELMPDSIKGQVRSEFPQASGAYAELAGLGGVLDCELTPSEIRQLALSFSNGGKNLGQLLIQGPLDLNKREGRVTVQLTGLDKNLLTFVAAGKGLDFRDSAFNSTNSVDIAQAGKFLTVSGTLNGARISVARTNEATPEFNLRLDYHANANLNEKSAVLQKLGILGEFGGRELIRGGLDRQMNLSWGENVRGYKEASFNLLVTNLSLADWRPVLGTNISSGVVTANLTVQSQQDGRQLSTEATATLANLNARFGTNVLKDTTLGLQIKGTLQDLQHLNISRYDLTVDQANQRVAMANGAVRYDLQKKEAGAQLTGEAAIPKVLAIYPVSGAAARTGVLKLNATYSNAGKTKIAANVDLLEFTGTYGSYVFENYQTRFEANLEHEKQLLQIYRAAATFNQGFDAGGSFDLAGKYDTEKKLGQFTFKLVDLNAHALRPILGPSLGENKLVSISLNGSGNANLDPNGETSAKTSVKVSNWVVQDKEGKLPKTPLALDLELDGGMRKELLELRKFLVQLTATDRAKNALHLEGRLDLAKTNPAPSILTLRSDSLDITRLYNMFAGPGQTNAPPASGSAGPSTPAATPSQQKEPDPVNLPFQQLTATLKMDRFYLRDLAISNWVGTIGVRSNVVSVKPFQLAVNGGKLDITGAFDLAVPGYKYELALGAEGIPLEPIVNTFSTNSTGQLQGNLMAQARVSGAGVTGTNIQRNLVGNVYFSLTNLNYQVVGPKLRKILVPISIALQVPELLQTPLNFVEGRTDVGSGRVNLQQLVVQSEAFLAESSGAIELAPVLTNSPLNVPLDLSLRRPLAAKSKLLPANVPPDAKYAKLPRFVTVKGTLGDPNPDINKLAIAGMIARGAANLGLGGDKENKLIGAAADVLTGQGTNSPGDLLKGLGGLLGKDQARTNPPASTNAPKPDAGAGLLRGLGGLLGGQTTNNPPNQTNAPGTTNQPRKVNPLDLFRGLQPPK